MIRPVGPLHSLQGQNIDPTVESESLELEAAVVSESLDLKASVEPESTVESDDKLWIIFARFPFLNKQLTMRSAQMLTY
jgi:hypothetical protein